jgi:hypothetical protein
MFFNFINSFVGVNDVGVFSYFGVNGSKYSAGAVIVNDKIVYINDFRGF